MTTKKKRIVKVALGADGQLRRILSSGKPGRIVHGRVDTRRIDRPAAFEPDADTPVLTLRELREMTRATSNGAPNVAALRRRLHLSQGAFAMIFNLPLATVKDWEQGRRKPDAPARAYLRVIAQNPEAVRVALRNAAE